MQEISHLTTASIFNQVYPVQKPEYQSQVTDASKTAYVFVLLTSSSGTNPESQLMIEIWRELARKFGDVKFCQMRADLCIEGYPDRNTPTVLVYKDGDVRKQLVTLRELRGDKTTAADLEDLLKAVGAVDPNDSRLQKRPGGTGEPERGIKRGTGPGLGNDDSDSDWD